MKKCKDVEIKARVTRAMRKQIKSIADQKGETISLVVREAVGEYLSEEKATSQMRSVYVAIRIPPDMVREAKQRAASDGRTLSNYIKNLIRCDLKKSRKPRLTSTRN